MDAGNLKNRRAFGWVSQRARWSHPRRVSIRLVTGTIAAATLGLVATSVAEAATVWRGTTLNAFGYGPAAAQQDLDLHQQAGANAVRIDIGWANLEPDAKGGIDTAYVARVDDYLQQADSRGLKVIAVVQGTPCWASSAPENLRQGCAGDWRGRGSRLSPGPAL